MSQMTVEAVLRFIHGLRVLQDQTGEYLSQHGLDPARGSPAAQEIGSCSDRELLETAYGQGDVLIQVGSEHLAAFLRAVAEPVLTIAAWSSVRGLMEASALSSWLLEPRIGAHVRIQRSFAFRFEGLSQQSKFARIAKVASNVAAVERRSGAVETRAIGLGFQKVRDRKGRRDGIAQRMPAMTSLAAQVFDAESTYRLLSAMTHAHPWALQRLSFDISHHRVLPDESQAGDSPRAYSLRKAAKPVALGFLCIECLRFFAKPVRYKAALFGWDSHALDQLIERIVDESFWLLDDDDQKTMVTVWR